MALVECIECGNLISESAVSCPNCGASGSKSVSYCPYCELTKNQKVLMNYSKENRCFTCPNCMRTVKLATPEEEAIIKQNRRLVEIQNSNKIKCPYCTSTNVEKISTVNRVVSTGIFGLASKKIGKQYHCKNCKSDF